MTFDLGPKSPTIVSWFITVKGYATCVVLSCWIPRLKLLIIS